MASRIASKPWGQQWPARARAWRRRTPPGRGAVRGHRRPCRRPARQRGGPRQAPRWSPHALWASSVLGPPPHGSLWGASALGSPSARRCVRSWRRCRREALGAVGPSRPSPHWPRCGGVSSGARPSLPRASSAVPPRWPQRCRFSMRSGSPRRPMRWRGAIDAIARGPRVSTEGGRTRSSVRVWRSRGGARLTPKAANKPLPDFILRELDKPGSSATVSTDGEYNSRTEYCEDRFSFHHA